MPKAISLHIGLNFVDPNRYDGWDGQLAACEYDADDMTALAKSRGFKPTTLLRGKATAKAVKTAISKAAAKLAAGDIFLLSYSGHGGQVPDLNGDEGTHGDAADRMDETWCLFDRELIDDELAALWATFQKGVRIVVFSDSCHSGSVTRAAPAPKREGRVRAMPAAAAARVYEKNKAMYDAIQHSLTGAEDEKIAASVLLVSGCMDQQSSSDGDRNGLFTQRLLETWADGTFRGGYRRFRDQIAAKMPSDQTPVYFYNGTANRKFEREQPFTADPAKVVKPPVKPKATKTEPIDLVLKALAETGFPNPQPDSNLKGWFSKIQKEDEAYQLPEPRRVAQFVEKLRSVGISTTATDLVKGALKTPSQLSGLS